MIEKLSKTLVREVTAYSELSDLNECLIQLVYNSIDAEASIIVVKFDPGNFYVEIIDNGKGMNLDKGSPVGRQKPNLYGQRGTFLENLACICDTVEIESGSWRKIFCQKSTWTVPNAKNGLHFGTLVRAFNIFGTEQIRQNHCSFDLHNLLSALEILSLVNFRTKFYFENLREKKIIFNSNQSSTLIDKFKYKFKNFLSFYEHHLCTDKYTISAIFASDRQKGKNYLFLNNFYLKNQIYYELMDRSLGHHRFNYGIFVTTSQLKYRICHHGSLKDYIEFASTELEKEFEKWIKEFVLSFLVKMGLAQATIGPSAHFSSPDLQPEELKNSRTSKPVKLVLNGTKKINFTFKNLGSKKLYKNKKIVQLNRPGFSAQLAVRNAHGKNKAFDLNLVSKRDQSTQTECPSLKENWTRLWNEQGTEFYVNKLNGYSTYDLNLVKASPTTTVDNSDKILKINYHSNSNNYDLLVNDVRQSVLNRWHLKHNVQTFGSSCQFKIDKKIFQNLKTIGQVDRKFIASFSRTLVSNASCVSIFLFDQHAAHERVRLEHLLSQNMQNNFIISEYLDNYIDLGFSWTGAGSLERLEELRKFGLEIKVDAHKSYLVKGPKFLKQKIDRNENGIVEKMSQLIQSELEKSNCQAIESASGQFSLSKIPQEYMELFNTEACRGAIKFGDELSAEICTQLVNKLSFCQMPFSCAHGRPTVVPVKQIFKKDVTRNKPKLNKLLKDF